MNRNYETLPIRSDRGKLSVAAGEGAIYLFAFIPSDHGLVDEVPAPSFEQRLFWHRVGSIRALVGSVLIDDYSGPDAQTRLANVAWVGPRVRRHGELVEWVRLRTPVFPAPFATLYTSLDSLTTFMVAHEEAIVTFLAQVAMKEEWELQAIAQLADPGTLDRLACMARPEWSKLSKGVRYIRLCSERTALLELGRTEAAAFMRDFVDELDPFVADIRVRGRGGDTSSGETIARYALLVWKSEVGALRDFLRTAEPRAMQHHVELSLKGPWPPFSFRPDLA